MAGMVPSFKTPLVLDINQISNYRLSNSTFRYNRVNTLVREALRKRFGITQNINEEVYDLVLEFSPETGQFVKNHLWHYSQFFELLPNRNYLLRLRCGINRELVGWIFQWMGNVKIIGPDILIQYYREQLTIMLQNLQGESLGYTNIFQPV